jgi:ubiquinone/menaquinone biosynthesis C-methylase UbiE
MSIAEANKQYFDLISDSYDSKPWFAKVNQQVTDTLRSRLDWIGIPFANLESASHDREVKLLDYACGTGIMSRVGANISLTSYLSHALDLCL